MQVVSFIVIALLILATLWWVLRPLWETSPAENTHSTPDTQKLDELFHQREAIYTSIKDLDEDLAADKVTEHDYNLLQTKLKTQAAAILKQIDQAERLTDDALDTEIDKLLEQLKTQPVDNEQERLRAQVRAEILKTEIARSPHRCPNCQYNVEPDDAFCSQCGTSLQNLCPACEAIVSPKDQFCAQCGMRLIPEAVE